VSGPNWSRRQAKRPRRESLAYPGRPSRIACVASERTTRDGAVGEKRKGSLCVFPWPGICSVEVPERREPVQPPAVRAHLGQVTSQRRAAAAPEPASPPEMGQMEMVRPVARPVEEVSVLARWTSERAAPKDRPPLFLGVGIVADDTRRSVIRRSGKDGRPDTPVGARAQDRLGIQPCVETCRGT
jgi:hypothetical protein